MKKWPITLLLAVIFLPLWASLMADKWESQWKGVDEAVSKGLPKTAIDR